MSLRLHRVRSELALDGRFGKDVRVIMLIQYIVGDVLNDCGCLFVIDQGGCFDNKLFRIEFELLKNGFFNTGQNCNNCFSCQTSLSDQLANQIILHAAARANLPAAVISRGLRLRECTSAKKRIL